MADITRIRRVRFNSQPPEGGWIKRVVIDLKDVGFNSQPPEGGWSIGTTFIY